MQNSLLKKKTVKQAQCIEISILNPNIKIKLYQNVII